VAGGRCTGTCGMEVDSGLASDDRCASSRGIERREEHRRAGLICQGFGRGEDHWEGRMMVRRAGAAATQE
jgi:hypothetical protein